MSAMPPAETQKQILSKVQLFSGLADSEMDFLAPRVVPRKFSPGQIVFNEGDPCSGLYVVASGQVRIFKTSASGREQELCLTHPQVALKVLRVVGARLRRLVGIIEELSFTTVRHRLAAFLVRVANREGVRTGSSVAITLPDNNQEIASQIGTVRELVSRNLSRLQAEGLIEINGRRLTIRDIETIEAEVNLTD